MNRARAWIPYLWAIPLYAFAWHATHDDIVRHMGLPAVNPWLVFLLILTGYSITLVACHRRPITIHQLGHLLVFEAATFLGFRGSDLQCVAGFMYLYMIAGTTAVTVLGAAVLAITRLLVPRRQSAEPQM